MKISLKIPETVPTRLPTLAATDLGAFRPSGINPAPRTPRRGIPTATQLLRSATLLASIAGLTLLLGVGSGCRRHPDAGPKPAVIEAVNRGVSLMGQYDYDGAVKAFDEALVTAPELADVKVNLAIARFNRGNKESHDIEEATRLVDAVVQQNPSDVRALYFKGIILQHIGHTDAAVPCFEKVLQLRPNDGVAWYLLGLGQQRLGQDPQKALLRAVELRPYLASAYYRLWQTLQASGKSAEAAPYLERFKQLRESSLAETIELPQYNQMGDLALVVPVGAAAPSLPAKRSYHAGTPQDLSTQSPEASLPAASKSGAEQRFGGAAFLPANSAGETQVFLTGWLPTSANGEFILKMRTAGGIATAVSKLAGLATVGTPEICAIGDYDNDELPDLFVVDHVGNHLLRGAADGTFTNVPNALAAPASGGSTRSALWLDSDHDGDLDLFVCNAGAPNQLFQNNSDGTFTDIAAAAGVAEPAGDSVMVLPGDIDGDRDVDLVLLRKDAPARIFLNELSGKFREASLEGIEMRGDLGGVLQDFDGDGNLDVLVLGGQPAELKLFLGDGHGHFRPSASFAEATRALAEIGPLSGFRVADLDLDGSLDIAVFGPSQGDVLFNDGAGHFVLQSKVWSATPGAEIVGAELADLTGDFVPDLLLLERGATQRVRLIPGVATPSATAIAITPTGVRSRDKRTRSPASGYGVAVDLRAGTHEQMRLCTGQSGGFNQSQLPVAFGLASAPHADYVKLLWSDGVAQVERELVAGRRHVIAESQRKISSCPVLFTWNGSRYEFITDFAGVGGLGYFVAPGEYASPQPFDYVKIEPQQLCPRNGRYELRITEAMEETAYVDRLELLAIDQPADWTVFPDERLAVSGPPPTHELLAVAKPIFALHAVNPDGADCTESLRHTDRVYAYEPPLDRRFFGFAQPHALELDFGEQLATLQPGERVFMFITGYLEYPYSQTAFAAGQANVGWQPIRVERRQPDGHWETIVADAGALGGAARTMTVDLTGLVGGSHCQLRLSSNLEIYYDQIFLGVPEKSDRVTVHSLPLAEADLRYLGFAREVSPDGRLPLIYDYQQIEPWAPFNSLAGAYTRYGPVGELLAEFDDQYVLVGPGDEIAASFDATRLPPVAAGMTRSFMLVSTAYCKDMDLYTATPQTLAPMPFRGMSRYPYPETEHYPDTELHRQFQAKFNTRIVK